MLHAVHNKEISVFKKTFILSLFPEGKGRGLLLSFALTQYKGYINELFMLFLLKDFHTAGENYHTAGEKSG